MQTMKDLIKPFDKQQYNKDYYQKNKEYWKEYYKTGKGTGRGKVAGLVSEAKGTKQMALDRYNKYMKEDYDTIRRTRRALEIMKKGKNQALVKASSGRPEDKKYAQDYVDTYQAQKAKLKKAQTRSNAAYGDIQKELAMERYGQNKGRAPQAMISKTAIGDRQKNLGIAESHNNRGRAPQIQLSKGWKAKAAATTLKRKGSQTLKSISASARSTINKGKDFIKGILS